MGVDYYTCEVCQETYADCGPVFTCYSWNKENRKAAGCERMFCSAECGQPQGEGASLSCVGCRNEITNDRTLLAFLLAKFGLTREAVATECVAARKAEAARLPISGGSQ